MPKLISELAAGQQYQFSSKEGQIAASQTRRFRILLQQAGEVFNIQETCQVFIGDVHPLNQDLFCTNYSAEYEGDSRMVVVVTFSYESTPSAASSSGGGGGGKDPKQFKPEERPANWYWSSSTTEVPVRSWRPVPLKDGATADVEPAKNPAGDMYDGITRLEPVVTITVEQFETEFSDKAYYVGTVNAEEFTIGDTFAPRTLLVKGISAKPVHESHKGEMRRGWKVSYEIAYRSNQVAADYADGVGVEQDIGWDIAVPVSGFNVTAFAPNQADAIRDSYGQPLKHNYGRIVPPLALPDNVTAGEKVRGMVKVLDYENGGTSQAPSASPIPLNLDGTPRKSTATPAVLVLRYCVHKQTDFKELGLRLE